MLFDKLLLLLDFHVIVLFKFDLSLIKLLFLCLNLCLSIFKSLHSFCKLPNKSLLYSITVTHLSYLIQAFLQVKQSLVLLWNSWGFVERFRSLMDFERRNLFWVVLRRYVFFVFWIGQIQGFPRRFRGQLA